MLFAALFLACSRGLKNVCTRLIALLGVNTSQRTLTGGRSLLHAAAAHNKADVVQVLLWRRCCPRSRDCRGQTAAELAEHRGAREALLVLLRHEAAAGGDAAVSPTTPRPRSAAEASVSPSTFAFPLPGQRRQSAAPPSRTSRTPEHLATSGET